MSSKEPENSPNPDIEEKEEAIVENSNNPKKESNRTHSKKISGKSQVKNKNKTPRNKKHTESTEEVKYEEVKKQEQSTANSKLSKQAHNAKKPTKSNDDQDKDNDEEIDETKEDKQALNPEKEKEESTAKKKNQNKFQKTTPTKTDKPNDNQNKKTEKIKGEEEKQLKKSIKRRRRRGRGRHRKEEEEKKDDDDGKEEDEVEKGGGGEEEKQPKKSIKRRRCRSRSRGRGRGRGEYRKEEEEKKKEEEEEEEDDDNEEEEKPIDPNSNDIRDLLMLNSDELYTSYKEIYPKIENNEPDFINKLTQIIENTEQDNPFKKNTNILLFIVFYVKYYNFLNDYASPMDTLLTYILQISNDSDDFDLKNLLSDDIYKNFNTIVEALKILSITHIKVQEQISSLDNLEDELKKIQIKDWHNNNFDYVYDYVFPIDQTNKNDNDDNQKLKKIIKIKIDPKIKRSIKRKKIIFYVYYGLNYAISETKAIVIRNKHNGILISNEDSKAEELEIDQLIKSMKNEKILLTSYSLIGYDETDDFE